MGNSCKLYSNAFSNESNEENISTINVKIPKNYFPQDDITKRPIMRWRGSAHIVFTNWLNYCVYQNTPFNLDDLTELHLNRI